MEKIYDLIIVGAGPAGLTAAVYAGRCLLSTLVIGELRGGTITEAHKVCNFPSYKSITGIELTDKLIEQVEHLGVEVHQERVEGIKKSNTFEIKTGTSMYRSKTIILATGSEKRKLNIDGEKEFLGRGVSYCAICDAAFFRNRVVSVVGGSNAALTAALLLSEHAKKVYIIYRGERFSRPEPAWIRLVEKNNKIEPVFSSKVKAIKGSDRVESVVLDSGHEISVDGVFVEVGMIPSTGLAEQLGLELDGGYIMTGRTQKTSVQGVFAAGDITNNTLKQAVTAAAEGAIAATSAYEIIR